MISQKFRIALLLFLLVAAFAGAWYLIGNRVPKPTGLTRPLPKQPRKATGPAELVTLEKVRASYALKPDMRFVMAFAEIDRFLGRQRSTPPVPAFEGDHWMLTFSDLQPARISLYPDYGEFDTLLLQYVEQRMKQLGVSMNAGYSGPKGLLVEHFVSASPLRALEEVDREWKGNGSSAYLMSEAARSMALLSFELADDAGIGNLIRARALASLAIAKSVTHAPQDEAEVLLAYSLGYTEHAKKIARNLPSTSPIAMFVLHRDADLEERVVSGSSDRLTKYMFIQRLADRGKWDDWVRQARVLFPDFDPALPLLKSAMDTGDFDIRRNFSPQVSTAALKELAGVTGSSSAWARVTNANQIDALDSLLSELHFDGLFVDSTLLQTYYSSYFYSGLTDEGYFYLDSLSSVQASTAFSKKLGTPKSALGKEFTTWYAHLAEFKAGKRKWESLREDVGLLPHLGRGLVMRIMNDVLGNISSRDPRLLETAKQYAALLDTRPDYRRNLASTMYNHLDDVSVASGIYASFIECCKDRSQRTFVWYSGFSGNVRELLASEEIGEGAKVDVFHAVADSKDSTGGEIADLFRRLKKEYPDNISLPKYYSYYLAANGRSREAEQVLDDWIQTHSYTKYGLRYVSVCVSLADLLRKDGRSRDAWTVLEPVISSWKEDALGEAALLLDEMGNEKAALDMGKNALERYPDSGAALGVNVRLLWKKGEYKQAAELLKHQGPRVGPSEWCTTISGQFAEVFASRPKSEALQAVGELAAARLYGPDLKCLAKQANRLKHPELSFAIMTFLNQKNLVNVYDLLIAYYYKEAAEGKDSALAWLRQELNPQTREVFAYVAFGGRAFDLLWDVASSNPQGKYHDDLWLLRAAAAVKSGSGGLHWKELTDHYSAPEMASVDFNPRNRTGRMVLLGKYLMGMISTEELLKASPDNNSLCDAAFYIAVKAEGAGDYETACRYYRLAVETQQVNNVTYGWAIETLASWRATGRNFEYIRAHKSETLPPGV